MYVMFKNNTTPKVVRRGCFFEAILLLGFAVFVNILAPAKPVTGLATLIAGTGLILLFRDFIVSKKRG